MNLDTLIAFRRRRRWHRTALEAPMSKRVRKIKPLETRWRVRRSRNGWWVAFSPWALTDDGRFYTQQQLQCHTWREAFDHADQMARA